MAERRMFAKTIIDGDRFIEMPLPAQALYFHLGMHADDDGFLNNPKRLQRVIGATDEDLKKLIDEGFILPFESGIVVIAHWKINNYIQKDRYTPTIYTEEKDLLGIKGNNCYTLEPCIQSVSKTDTQVSIGEGNQNSIGEVRVEEQPTPPKLYGKYGNVCLTLEEYKELSEMFPTLYQAKIERLSKWLYDGKFCKNHYETLMKWCAEDAAKPPKPKRQEYLTRSSTDLDALEMAALWGGIEEV